MRIGISIGDIGGIGPEVTLKALAATDLSAGTEYLLLGDFDTLHNLNRSLKTNLPLQRYDPEQPGTGIPVHNAFNEPLPSDLPPGAAPAARAAVAWTEDGARRCLRGELHALVTAPVNKESIIRSGRAFVGQTELLSELAGTDRTVMMLLGHDDRGRWLRVALATTHVPIKLLAESITADKVELAIERAAEACGKLGLPRARVAVCGLNPHAGEGGKLGDEELRVIAPAVERMRTRGIDVSGPWSADTLFHSAYQGNCEAVVAMYHDQGLAPLKMVAFDSGVNWTLGLPFVRTSPDHGTAYDIAPKRVADPASMLSAINLAKQLSTRSEAV